MQESDSQQSALGGKQEYLSRRERRQLMRQQRGGGAGVPRWVRRTLLWGGSVLVLALVVWGMVKLSGSTPLPTDTGTLTDAVTERDNILGPASASVTLVEYSDFQCPACAAFQPIVKQLLTDPQLDGKVRLVYRSFPLTNIHPNAPLAARAAQAAAAQGKFWQMHDMLFERQQAWAKLTNAAARDTFIAYASELGLEAKTFTDALESDAVKDQVKEQSDSAERAGVNSTPTFFINGSKMPQVRNYEEFRQNLLNAVNANP